MTGDVGMDFVCFLISATIFALALGFTIVNLFKSKNKVRFFKPFYVLITGVFLSITVLFIPMNYPMFEDHSFAPLVTVLSSVHTAIMHFFGMSDKASFLWIVGNLVGLSYGGAIMVDMVDNSKITKGEAHYVNSHLSMSHSLIEDTLLFVVLGISVWWIMGTRLLFALLVVWAMRAFKKLIS